MGCCCCFCKPFRLCACFPRKDPSNQGRRGFSMGLGSIVGKLFIFIFFLNFERSSFHWFIPQVSATGQSWEPGAQATCPMWVAGAQVLEASPAASQGVHGQEAGSDTEEPGLDPGALMWNASVPSGILTAVPDTCLRGRSSYFPFLLLCVFQCFFPGSLLLY